MMSKDSSFSPNGTALSTNLLDNLQKRPWGSTILVGFLIYIALGQIRYYRQTPKITSVGFVPIPFIGSWIAAFRFLRAPEKMIREGQAKSPNGIFRIATHMAEYVIVTDPDKVTEYLKAPDSVLNAQDGANDQQQIPHTLGHGVAYRAYHNIVVRGPVTKNIMTKTPAMIDEATLALGDLIGSPKDWTPVALYDCIAMTVARISNRVYVGTEFCRNTEYLQNAADYAQSVVISAEILKPFPEWAKPFITQLLPVMRHRRAAEKFLGRYIQDRLDSPVDKNGEKHDDLVRQLIDAAPPVERTVPQLAERVMALNVASIHTSTMVFSAALYAVAAEWDKYAHALREEVMSNLEGGEITYHTLTNLPKMESFLRESGRLNVVGLMAMQRNARQDFKFSDGSIIPAGCRVGASSLLLHRHEEAYENPDEFDGFRFLAPKYTETRMNTPVGTSRNYHVFGHGRHPCPGRFFANHEMKLVFALLLLKYDFKLAPGDRPQPFFIATMAIPDTTLKVQFKART